MAPPGATGRQDPLALLDLLGLDRKFVFEPTALSADSAVERGLAAVGGYAFSSVDYPGACVSFLADTNGTTAVGYYLIDPNSPYKSTAFTFKGGVYRAMTVPNSTESTGTGINTAGTIVGTYDDTAGKRRGSATPAARSPTSGSRMPPTHRPSASTTPEKLSVPTRMPTTPTMDSSTAEGLTRQLTSHAPRAPC